MLLSKLFKAGKNNSLFIITQPLEENVQATCLAVNVDFANEKVVSIRFGEIPISDERSANNSLFIAIDK